MIDNQTKMWYSDSLNNFIVYPLRKCRDVPGIDVGVTLERQHQNQELKMKTDLAMFSKGGNEDGDNQAAVLFAAAIAPQVVRDLNIFLAPLGASAEFRVFSTSHNPSRIHVQWSSEPNTFHEVDDPQNAPENLRAAYLAVLVEISDRMYSPDGKARLSLELFRRSVLSPRVVPDTTYPKNWFTLWGNDCPRCHGLGFAGEVCVDPGGEYDDPQYGYRTAHCPECGAKPHGACDGKGCDGCHGPAAKLEYCPLFGQVI